MKVLITGGHGQLGTAIQQVMKEEELLPTDSDTMDITEKAQVEKVFAEFKPDFLVHGAAYTNVDGCEDNPVLARKVNAEGTQILVDACKKSEIPMIYISTDYVFDGTATAPIPEDAPTGPISVYGETKLAGESATLSLENGYVLRTSWVYGEGHNFVRTMLSLADKTDELKIVNDQFGRPTYAVDLAKAIYDVILSCHSREGGNPVLPGIYNVTGDGEIISWADFAREIFKIAGKNTEVVGISTEKYLSDKQDRKIAPRPLYSALDLTKSKNEGIYIANYLTSLERYIHG